ncbi:putative Transposase [Seiridium cardinale]
MVSIGLDNFKDWKFRATENGWTTDTTAVEWLQKVFIPYAMPEDPKDYQLLIVDGHGSHRTTDFIDWQANFLSCYQKARMKGLSGQNIRGGWEAASLWPVSMVKPLMSRNLVDYTRKTTPEGTRSKMRLVYPYGDDCEQIVDSEAVWSSPKRTSEFTDQILLSNRLQEHTTTQRLSFKKIRKAFNNKNFPLAATERQI